MFFLYYITLKNLRNFFTFLIHFFPGNKRIEFICEYNFEYMLILTYVPLWGYRNVVLYILYRTQISVYICKKLIYIIYLNIFIV